MKCVVNQSTEDLSDEQQKLLSDGYKEVTNGIIRAMEALRTNGPNEFNVPPQEAAEFCRKLEKELVEVCEEIIVSACSNYWSIDIHVYNTSAATANITK